MTRAQSAQGWLRSEPPAKPSTTRGRGGCSRGRLSYSGLYRHPHAFRLRENQRARIGAGRRCAKRAGDRRGDAARGLARFRWCRPRSPGRTSFRAEASHQWPDELVETLAGRTESDARTAPIEQSDFHLVLEFTHVT